MLSLVISNLHYTVKNTSQNQLISLKMNQKKQILILSAVFPPEPVVSATLSADLAKELAIKNKVTVLSPRPTRPLGFKFENPDLNDTFNHIVLQSYVFPESKILGRLRESYSFGKATERYIHEHHESIDRFYANTWPLFAQYFAIKAAIRYHLPIILHVQDIYPESLANKLPIIGPLVKYLLRPMDAWILRNATKVIAISEKMKDHLVKTRSINPSHIEVVTNWQDEQPFLELQKNNISNGKDLLFTFMYLGNIGPVAGCDLLIDAFTSLQYTNIRLVIAGSGSMKDQLMKQVSDQKIGNVEFWPVPDGQVPATQDLADILLLPIKKGAAFTSIPSKLPAYMFSAKPIIATVDYDSDTAQAIREAGCGWVIEPENPAALVVFMQKVYRMSKEELDSIGLKGREFALKHYSKNINLSNLVRLIEQEMIKLPNCS